MTTLPLGALPHIFSDGPGNTASGVQVTEDDEFVKAGVNELNTRFDDLVEGRRLVAECPVVVQAGYSVGKFFLRPDGVFVQDGSTGTAGVALVNITAADFAVTAKTSKLRLDFVVVVNSVGLGGCTVTFGLYPVTAVIGSFPSVSLGSVVAGSGVAMSNAWSSTVAGNAGSNFDVPADTAYALGAEIGVGGPAANHKSVGTLRLTACNV